MNAISEINAQIISRLRTVYNVLQKTGAIDKTNPQGSEAREAMLGAVAATEWLAKAFGYDLLRDSDTLPQIRISGRRRATPNRRHLTTPEEVRKIAKSYTEISSFRLNHPSLYSAAWRWGRLEEFTAHMSRKGTKRLRYIYSISLDHEVYYGLSADPRFRFNQHASEGTEDVRDLIQRGAILTVLSGALANDAAQSMERSLIIEARRAGKRVLNTTLGGELGGYVTVWNTEAIIKEASKYRTRFAFQGGSPAAYNAAHRKKILDMVCSHMKPARPGDWRDPKAIAKEASKYKTRTGFYKGSGGAYAAARRAGIMDDVCQHMDHPR
jgi:hypothetical protein